MLLRNVSELTGRPRGPPSSVGIDLPGGNPRQILQSIHDKLMALPETAVVIPGHGPNTTIGREKERNPFLQS